VAVTGVQQGVIGLVMGSLGFDCGSLSSVLEP
jgi:hypothetical protein